jgi:hypothetical protein
LYSTEARQNASHAEHAHIKEANLDALVEALDFVGYGPGRLRTYGRSGREYQG